MSSVLDLGCGDGKLLQALFSDKQFTRIAGTDVSMRSLSSAAARFRWDEMTTIQQERLTLFQSSATYRDTRFSNFDAIVSIEVIEHLDASRLPAFERSLFEFGRPGVVIITTPNREFNVLFGGIGENQLRHSDHRFEWTRAEFQRWAEIVADQYGYDFRILPIGDSHEQFGPPTQMALFTRKQDGST